MAEAESLKDISVHIKAYDYLDQMNSDLMNHEAVYNFSGIEDRIKGSHFAIELLESWERQFNGGSFSCGILYLDPWFSLDYTEEELISFILDHAKLNEKNHTLTFKFDTSHPLFGFFRTHSTFCNMIANVETVFRLAIKKDCESEDAWEYFEIIYCEECEIAYSENELKTGFQWAECPNGHDLTEE